MKFVEHLSCQTLPDETVYTKKYLLVFKDYKIISGIKEIPSQHLLAQS